MRDLNVVTSLIQLKALVAGLYGRIDAIAGASTPEVDFAVDMFDRPDQNTLGDYWQSNGFGVRDNLAVRVEGETTDSTLLTVHGSATIHFVFSSATLTKSISASIVAHNFGGNAMVSSAYLANMSSPDFMCKVLAYVPPKIDGPQIATQTGSLSDPTPPGYSGTCSVSGYVEGGVADEIAVNAGLCVADSQNNSGGVCTSIGYIPSASVHSTATTQESINPPATEESDAALTGAAVCLTRYGSSAASIQKLSTEIRSDSSSSPHTSASCSAIDATYGVAALGANTVIAENAGDNTTFTINGITVFSGTLQAVPKNSRTRAGIAALAHNTAAASMVYPELPIGGVTAFKAWRNDIPEPPNETGHGTYVNGHWQYADKYHTPVTDADGNVVRNEDGTVAGYTYNPEA
jgi:hypothetical protein